MNYCTIIVYVTLILKMAVYYRFVFASDIIISINSLISSIIMIRSSHFLFLETNNIFKISSIILDLKNAREL
jgi:hypothetical protein